jgi:hypothetical protein
MSHVPIDSVLRRTVFGLDVWSETQVEVLSGACARHTGRTLDLLLAYPGTLPPWSSKTRRISEQLDEYDRPVVMIDHEEEAGFLVHGPRYGVQLISTDGSRVQCFTDNVPAQEWQRLLVAQTLPFAAALNGLEVFHASAVQLAGKALALVGPSGSGKTSLALALCRLGAEFLADDVLAAEPSAGRLLAHPGTPLAAVVHRGRASHAWGGRRVLAVNERERLVALTPASAPAEVGGVLFLSRRAAWPQATITPLDSAGALLSSTFNFVLDAPARLERLLETCSLAAARPVCTVTFDAEANAEEIASLILRWFEDSC